ncbi:unnamed protein product [Malus baccata var. baccata]
MGFLFKFFGCDFGDFVYGLEFWVMMINLVLFLVSGDPVFRVSDVSLQHAKASLYLKKSPILQKLWVFLVSSPTYLLRVWFLSSLFFIQIFVDFNFKNQDFFYLFNGFVHLISFLTRDLRHHCSTKLADSFRSLKPGTTSFTFFCFGENLGFESVYTKKLNFDLCFGIPLLEFFDLGIVENSTAPYSFLPRNCQLLSPWKNKLGFFFDFLRYPTCFSLLPYVSSTTSYQELKKFVPVLHFFQ